MRTTTAFFLRLYLLISLFLSTESWIQQPLSHQQRSTKLFNVGGWGSVPQRELTPEEFAARGERRHFEGYKLQGQGEFMQQLSRDKDDFKKSEMEEIMNVARIAGIKVKDPSERGLNKFGEDDMKDDDDDLDVSV